MLTINIISIESRIKASLFHGMRTSDVSLGEILHFKYPSVSAVHRIATRTFRDKKQQQQSSFFLSTLF